LLVIKGYGWFKRYSMFFYNLFFKNKKALEIREIERTCSWIYYLFLKKPPSLASP
jgi:hypothetical protein